MDTVPRDGQTDKKRQVLVQDNAAIPAMESNQIKSDQIMFIDIKSKQIRIVTNEDRNNN